MFLALAGAYLHFANAQPPSAAELARITAAHDAYRSAYLEAGVAPELAGLKAQLDAETWVLGRERRRLKQIPLPSFVLRRLEQAIEIAQGYEDQARVIENRLTDPADFSRLVERHRQRRTAEMETFVEVVNRLKPLHQAPLDEAETVAFKGIDLETFHQGFARFLFRDPSAFMRQVAWEIADPYTEEPFPLSLRFGWIQELTRKFPQAFFDQYLGMAVMPDDISTQPTEAIIKELLGNPYEVEPLRRFLPAARACLADPNLETYLAAVGPAFDLREHPYYLALIGTGSSSMSTINTNLVVGVAPLDLKKAGTLSYFDFAIRPSFNFPWHDAGHFSQLARRLDSLPSPEQASLNSARLNYFRGEAKREDLAGPSRQFTWHLEHRLFSNLHERAEPAAEALRIPSQITPQLSVVPGLHHEDSFWPALNRWETCNAALTGPRATKVLR